MSTLQLHDRAKVSPPPAGPSRIAGLDALRAVLAVLVVLLHASMPYMLAPFPGLAWPVHDDQPSIWVDAVGWWVDSFVMPAFLLLAGYVACELMQHKGPSGFLSHRVRRVLLPLVAAAAVLLPIELYLWLLAWVGQEEIAFVKLKSLKMDSPHGDHLWGLSHLWFLEYLFLYSLIAWSCLRPRRRTHDDAPHVIALSQSPSAPTNERTTFNPPTVLVALVGGLIAGGIMCWWPRVLIGFQHGWLPHPANFIAFGLVFAAGWWLARRQRGGVDVTSHCELLAAAGLAWFIVALPGLREFASVRDPHSLADWSTAVAFGLSGWLSAVGWWGVFVKHVRRPAAAAVRYLSEASFWLYLAHHPLVALLHVNLSLVNWPAGAKFAVASAASLTLSLAMYECFVRRMRLGAFLNGRRHVSQPPAAQEPSREMDGVRRAA